MCCQEATARAPECTQAADLFIRTEPQVLVTCRSCLHVCGCSLKCLLHLRLWLRWCIYHLRLYCDCIACTHTMLVPLAPFCVLCSCACENHPIKYLTGRCGCSACRDHFDEAWCLENLCLACAVTPQSPDGRESWPEQCDGQVRSCAPKARHVENCRCGYCEQVTAALRSAHSTV